jgi:hypothetical protein
MSAQHAYSDSPFRRGLADMMAETERRGARAYDRQLGAAPAYNRARDLPKIFGSHDVAALARVSPSRLLDLVVTQTIIAALRMAKLRFERHRHKAPDFYDAYLEDVDIALRAEQRIRIEQMAQERF